MGFADPQTITFDGDTVTLNRIIDDGLKSVYQTASGNFTFTINHLAKNSRMNRMVRVDHLFTKADPISGLNTQQRISAWFVMDESSNPGLQDHELLEFLGTALVAWLTASTNANMIKVLGTMH